MGTLCRISWLWSGLSGRLVSALKAIRHHPHEGSLVGQVDVPFGQLLGLRCQRVIWSYPLVYDANDDLLLLRRIQVYLCRSRGLLLLLHFWYFGSLILL